ncbi:MAG: hypothetical protein H6726_17170 [Sandaracinaceae bacterium]|nr:hypothetical protein [Myxococcales bacterium]MCB9659378.1 hypothetical protein [Sandaracinaceae bacterium]
MTDTQTTSATAPASSSSGGAVTPAGNEQASATPSKPVMAPAWLRILQAIAGVGLMTGFFMPWVTLGDMVSVSGFSLVLTGGDVVEQLSGPSRGVIFSIPLLGLALLSTAIKGFRVLAWAGLATGILILLVGLYTLITVFLDSTGMGMWVLIGAALLALGTGALAVRLSRPRPSADAPR